MTTISADQLTAVEAGANRATWSAASAPHAVTISIGDDVLRVHFELADWAELFAQRYADHIVTAAPNLLHYVVRTVGGYAFWSPDAAAWAWDRGELPASAVVFLADATAIGALLNASQTLVSFHAAAVAAGGVAGAIAGDSNAGKSTTAIACGRAGLRVYSDERCVLQGRNVVPFARAVNVRSHGWTLLQNARDGESRALPAGARTTADGFSVRISDLFGPYDRAAAPQLGAVFLLCGRADRVELESATWYEVAPALARWMRSRDRGLDRAARLMEILRDVSCYRLVLGTPDETADVIRTTLTGIADQRAS